MVTQYEGNPTSSAQWAQLVLEDGGAPVTQSNINLMLTWMENENYPANWAPRNNPLNASLGTDSTDGTGGYQSLNESAYYTARMIFGQSNMSGIAAALGSGTATPAQFGQAVISSPWASSHYGYNLARFTHGAPGSSPAATAAAAANQAGNPYAGACDDARYLINAASVHLINECQAKALLGGLWIFIGGVGMVIAGALFVASGFGRRSAAQTVGGTLSRVPGPVGAVGGALKGTPAPRRRAAGGTPTGSSSRSSQSSGTGSDAGEAFEAGRQRGAQDALEGRRAARELQGLPEPQPGQRRPPTPAERAAAKRRAA